MRILIVSDLESAGGAAIACQRLSQGLARLGAHCVRAVGRLDGGGGEQEKVLLSPGRRIEGISAFASAFDQNHLAEALVNFGVKRQLPLLIERVKPDVINIHNLHKANWNVGLVEECARHAPIVWTLHDMWSMTGRCAYNYDCEKFLTGCDAACPTPQEYPALKPSRIAAAWAAKKAVFEKYPHIAAACPSGWMASQAQRGIWKGHPIETIHNGLDLEIYKPREATASRVVLGIEPEIPTILMVADYLGERRKGGGLIQNILAGVKTRPLQILTLGHTPPQINISGVHHTHFGYVSSDLMKSIIYSAADLLLHMAPVDNLPNTVAEALACGTPVVAYATGGVPEMVIEGHTGWLSERFTPEGFAGALEKALATVRSGVLSRQTCRQFAEDQFDLERQASQYLRLFETLCATGPKNPQP